VALGGRRATICISYNQYGNGRQSFNGIAMKKRSRRHVLEIRAKKEGHKKTWALYSYEGN
jgi:hypothetical protein